MTRDDERDDRLGDEQRATAERADLEPGGDSGDGLDAELSLLLDGELDAVAAGRVRARLAADPVAAERFAALGEVDGLVRLLGAELPDAGRLTRLRADLQQRIERGADEATDRAVASPPRALGGGLGAGRRSPRRWLAPVAAALAAGLALYWLGGPVREPSPGATAPIATATPDAPAPPPALAAREAVATSDGTRVIAPAEEGAREAAGASLADTTRAAPAAELEPAAAPPSPEPGPAEPIATAAAGDDLPAGATDVELAVALDYDVLHDLDVIRNLELLELLESLDGPEPL